ncbi:hypothetical protein DFJ58DRAFT_736698 [Suillus subalutaceus]|uniref:uncharacterized protein n=1 Tax=Suillus subalutaceus TaxID=48586 RepID=UPI001B877904|nr:uncharacterized protein DFJ58DRAFT_736698 [Suillus subalutaceus]KAG1831217.1 hypothetical protein DFJ58DRAFT_736698 [Suillus subalutaceus]
MTSFSRSAEMLIEDRKAVEMMLVDLDVDIEHLPYTAPPGLSQQIADISGLHYVDLHTRRDCIDVQTANWNLQMEHLISAYLDYRTWDCGNGMPISSSLTHSVENVFLCTLKTFHKFPNESLIYHGYLGCSPLHLTVAISLHTLAAY